MVELLSQQICARHPEFNELNEKAYRYGLEKGKAMLAAQ